MNYWKRMYPYLFELLIFLSIILIIYFIVSIYAKNETMYKLVIKNNTYVNIVKDDSKDIQFIDDLIIIRNKHLSVKQFDSIIFDDLNHTIGFVINKITFVKRFDNYNKYKQRKNEIYKSMEGEYNNLMVWICCNISLFLFMLLWIAIS